MIAKIERVQRQQWKEWLLREWTQDCNNIRCSMVSGGCSHFCSSVHCQLYSVHTEKSEQKNIKRPHTHQVNNLMNKFWEGIPKQKVLHDSKFCTICWILGIQQNTETIKNVNYILVGLSHFSCYNIGSKSAIQQKITLYQVF